MTRCLLDFSYYIRKPDGFVSPLRGFLAYEPLLAQFIAPLFSSLWESALSQPAATAEARQHSVPSRHDMDEHDLYQSSDSLTPPKSRITAWPLYQASSFPAADEGSLTVLYRHSRSLAESDIHYRTSLLQRVSFPEKLFCGDISLSNFIISKTHGLQSF